MPLTTTHHTTSTTHRRTTERVSPIFMATNALIWISAVIVMGILAYFISLGSTAEMHVYGLVISVLTVVFFLVAFFLGSYPGYHLLFNIIFSYLWLVAVVFFASAYTYSKYALGQTVEAFSFIAFFLLFFNIVYDWHLSFRGRRTTSAV